MNNAPSFSGSSKVDREIKTGVINGALGYVGQTAKNKRKFLRNQKQTWAKRLWSSKPVNRDAKEASKLPGLKTSVPMELSGGKCESRSGGSMPTLEPAPSDDIVQVNQEVDRFENWSQDKYQLCYPVDTSKRLLYEEYKRILEFAAGCKSNVF